MISTPEFQWNGGPMEILLVHLPFYDYSLQLPQLGMLYVGSSLKSAGFTVGVLDDEQVTLHGFIDLVKKANPRIIGFHVNTDTAFRVRRAVEALRHSVPDMPLIMLGGPHVTVKDKHLLEESCGDIVVRGEGEDTAREIADWRLNGQGDIASIRGITYRTATGDIIRNPDREFIADLDKVPHPDRNLLINKPKYPTFNIITGRGCPYNCAFCAEGLSSIQYRFRSAESVLSEVDGLFRDESHGYLGILDDTFLVNRDRVEKIAKGLMERYGRDKRVIWFCEGRVDFINKNPDIFPLLKESGLVRVQIGIESGCQEVLDAYRKGVRIDEIENAVAILRDADIPSIYGNFILGGALESRETVQKTIGFAKRLTALAPGRMECSSTLLSTYPGTAVSENPARFGLTIVDREMVSCLSTQHPIAITESLGVHEILSACAEFKDEIAKTCTEVISTVPRSLIRCHINFKEYGLSTFWADVFLRYHGIKTYFEMINSGCFVSIRTIPHGNIFDMIPYRTNRIIDVDAALMGVKFLPRSIVFNDMSSRIYELCSGKLTVRDIIKRLRDKIEPLPPEPYLSDQVFRVLQDMDDCFLVVFSDL